MNVYSSFTESRTTEEATDVVTLEEFKYGEHAHPRAVITIRRTNGVPYPFMVSTVMNIINHGDGKDPSTRVPFTVMDRRRALLYNRALTEFPDYTRDGLNTTDLYERWVSIHKPDCELDKEKVRLEAQCFLQPEDLIGIFNNFHGSGSMLNRQEAVNALTENTTWILRKSSIQDTQYDKAYALTRIVNGDVRHYAIIHRLGEGFYFNAYGISRGDLASNQITDHHGFYPTIIDLLEDNVQLGTSFHREVSYSSV
jgi:hypothetical protein